MSTSTLRLRSGHRSAQGAITLIALTALAVAISVAAKVMALELRTKTRLLRKILDISDRYWCRVSTTRFLSVVEGLSVTLGFDYAQPPGFFSPQYSEGSKWQLHWRSRGANREIFLHLMRLIADLLIFPNSARSSENLTSQNCRTKTIINIHHTNTSRTRIKHS